MKRYNALIVPHTHWDREWYLPVADFRTKLVELIDGLLNLLHEDARYRNFTLDGQTIVLEDYLELRPEREADLKKLVSEGRILVGPWYTQPDEFLVSAESIVRNLMLGHKIAKSFGKVMKVGYIPDSFGHTSQIPQILLGFGIDSVVFSRGLDDEGKRIPTEFSWQSPDGSKIFAIHLRTTYCNAAGLPEDTDEASERVRTLIELLAPSASTSNILLMNGCDHLSPQPILPDLIEKLNRKLKDVSLSQGTLPDYVQRVREESPDLHTLTGEQRSPKYNHLLPGVISTRMYLKQENARTQTILEYFAEPLSTLAWILGSDYPQPLLWEAWRDLLRNHAHDSICGCSVDEVHRDMLKRFSHSKKLARQLIDQSIENIAKNLSGEDTPLSLLVFNPLGQRRTEVVQATISLPVGVRDFCITGHEGKSLPLQQVRRSEDKAEIVFLAKDLPPCGCRVYEVHESSQETRALDYTPVTADANTMENEFLKVKIESNGSLSISDKRTGKTYQGINVFEDSGDAGDEYNYSPPPRDEVITSTTSRTHSTLTKKGPLMAEIKVEQQLMIPEGLSENYEKRGEKNTSLAVASFVRLSSGTPRVDIKTIVNNKAKDHRLRILIPTGIKTESSHAETQYGVVKRSTRLPPPEASKEILLISEMMGWERPKVPGKPEMWIEDPPITHPQQTFVDINDGETGVTIINRGLPEYEVKEEPEGAVVALTLLRCVGWLSRPDLSTRSGNAGPMIETPEAQCLGEHRFEYSVAPHTGTWESSRTFELAHQFNAPMKAWQMKRRGGSLPRELSLVSIQPKGLILSAVKKSEEENALIIRFYNILKEEVKGRIKLFKPFKNAELVNLNEEPVKGHLPEVDLDGSVSLRVRPSEITTLKFSFD